MKKTCLQCGKEFELTQSEIDFFKQKGLSIPKRCKSCREENRTDRTPTVRRPESSNNGSQPRKVNPTIFMIALILLVVVFLGVKYFVDGGKGETTAATTAQNMTQATTAEPGTDATGDSTEATTEAPTEKQTDAPTEPAKEYKFRNNSLLKQHYEKHGIEMGFASQEEYELAAAAVINNPKALHKTEKEDGDFVYYVEETNEFVILSTDGYIRTYFNPSAGLDYYNRQ